MASAGSRPVLANQTEVIIVISVRALLLAGVLGILGIMAHANQTEVIIVISVRALLLAGVLGILGIMAHPGWANAEETAPAATPAAPAAPAATVNGADTGFIMIAAALVMLMTPGLGLFYGGMVRRKNVLATFQQSFILLGVVALQWVLFGYSLAFGRDHLGGLIGSLDWVGLNGVGLEPNADYAGTIPHQL